MARIFNMKDIRIVTEGKPGALASVTAPIANARVNIGAFCTFERGKDVEFHFVTADNEKVKQALEKAGFACTEREVIIVETANESGILFHTAQELAKAGVDPEYAYSTAGNMGTTWIVFATKTVEKAMNAMP
ncbi:MAG: hypothetical protein V2A66_07790 [Pseudomonadota bacterium]